MSDNKNGSIIMEKCIVCHFFMVVFVFYSVFDKTCA